MRQSLKLDSLPEDLRAIADELIADKFPNPYPMTTLQYGTTLTEAFRSIPVTFDNLTMTINEARVAMGILPV